MRSFVLETSHSYGHLHCVNPSLMQGAFPVPSRGGELEPPCAFRVRVEGGSSRRDAGTWTHSDLGVSFCQEPEKALPKYSAGSCQEFLLFIFFFSQIADGNEVPVVRAMQALKRRTDTPRISRWCLPKSLVWNTSTTFLGKLSLESCGTC